jgi:hypothetical protein
MSNATIGESKRWDGVVRIVSFLAPFLVTSAPGIAWALGLIGTLTSTPVVLTLLALIPAATVIVYIYVKKDSGNSRQADHDRHQARLESVWRSPFVFGCVTGLILSTLVAFVRLN